MCIVIQRENETLREKQHPSPNKVDGSILMNLAYKYKQSHCVGMRTKISRKEVTSVLKLNGPWAGVDFRELSDVLN